MEEFRLGSRTLQPHRQLLADGQRVALGKRALDILSVLARARGEIVTKDELLEAVWPDVTVEENALQVHIVALRKALGPEAERLKTVRGVGYQLDVDGETEAARAPGSEAPAISAASAVRSEKVTSQTLPPSPSWRAGPLAGARAAVGATARAHRLVVALAVLVAGLAAIWMLFGSDLGLRPHERIPVVVRPLIAEAGGAPTDAPLASGITNELIVRLRRLEELRIATAEANGAMPSDTFRNAYIVDGNIRSHGGLLRVNARLTRQDGEVLWSQTFDRKFADLFNVQEEIASAIANTLSVSFDVGGNSTAYGGTNNPEAYAAYMQAYAHQIDTAFDRRPYLEQAVALDPHYAKARSALYGDYGLQISLAASSDKPRLLADFDRNTREALSANPGLWIPEGRGRCTMSTGTTSHLRIADSAGSWISILDWTRS